MAISSALIVGPLLLIVFVEVWGVVLIARSPDDAVAEDVMVGLETIVVVVTLFVVLFPWLLQLAELFETLELLLPPDNDKVECSIIVLKRLILNKTNHATLFQVTSFTNSFNTSFYFTRFNTSDKCRIKIKYPKTLQ